MHVEGLFFYLQHAKMKKAIKRLDSMRNSSLVERLRGNAVLAIVSRRLCSDKAVVLREHPASCFEEHSPKKAVEVGSGASTAVVIDLPVYASLITS